MSRQMSSGFQIRGHEIILARETIEIAVSQYVLSLDNIAIVFIVDVIVDLEGWGEV